MKLTKACSCCRCELETYPNAKFRKQSKTPDGLKYVCINCDNEAQAQRYLNNKSLVISKVKEWQAANKDKVKKYKKKWRANR